MTAFNIKAGFVREKAGSLFEIDFLAQKNNPAIHPLFALLLWRPAQFAVIPAVLQA